MHLPAPRYPVKPRGQHRAGIRTNGPELYSKPAQRRSTLRLCSIHHEGIRLPACYFKLPQGAALLLVPSSQHTAVTPPGSGCVWHHPQHGEDTPAHYPPSCHTALGLHRTPPPPPSLPSASPGSPQEFPPRCPPAPLSSPILLRPPPVPLRAPQPPLFPPRLPFPSEPAFPLRPSVPSRPPHFPHTSIPLSPPPLSQLPIPLRAPSVPHSPPTGRSIPFPPSQFPSALPPLSTPRAGPHLAGSGAERKGLTVVVTGPIQRVLQLGPGAALRLADPLLALVIHGGAEDPPRPTHVPLPAPPHLREISPPCRRRRRSPAPASLPLALRSGAFRRAVPAPRR